MSASVNLGALAAQGLSLPANEPFSTSESSTISKALLNSSGLGGINHVAYVDYPADATNTFDQHAKALLRGDRCRILSFTLWMSSTPGVYGLMSCSAEKIKCLAINFLSGQDCAELQRELQSMITGIYNAEAEVVVLDKNEGQDNSDVWTSYMLERTLLTLRQQKAKFLDLSCQELANELLPKDEVDLNAIRKKYKLICQRAIRGKMNNYSESFKTKFSADMQHIEDRIADFKRRHGIDTTNHTVEEQLKEKLRSATKSQIDQLREVFKDNRELLKVLNKHLEDMTFFYD